MTDFDRRAHYIYTTAMSIIFFRGKIEDVACKRCRKPLQAYYCEDRLYLVRCFHCGTMALAKAENPKEAALMTLGTPCIEEET